MSSQILEKVQSFLKRSTDDSVDISEELIEEFGELCKSALRKQFTDKSNHKSNLKSDQIILRLLKANNKITIKQLCEKTKLSESGVKKVIRKLKDNSSLERVGSLKGGHWEVTE